MLQWFKKHNMIGGEIWAKYKDEFHYSSQDFGYWVESQMMLDQEFEHFYLQGKKFPDIPKYE
jgi:hypothetical protein